MREFQRTIYQGDLPLYQQAAGQFFDNQLKLVGSAPTSAPGLLLLTIAYRHEIDVFLLGLKVGEAKQAKEAPAPPAEPSYPQFFVNPLSHTFYYFSSPNVFIIVSPGQLQVQRDRPGQAYTVEREQTPITAAEFVQAYGIYRDGLLILTEMEGDSPPQYLHRGEGDEGWFYRLAGDYDAGYHLRLSVHTDEHGRNFNLLYALDTRPGDARRIPTTEVAFTQQLNLLFDEADAAVFGTLGKWEVAND